jgi:hypothetical protein
MMDKKHTPHPDDIKARQALAKLPKPSLEQVMTQAETSRKFREEWDKKHEATNLRARPISISKGDPTRG